MDKYWSDEEPHITAIKTVYTMFIGKGANNFELLLSGTSPRRFGPSYGL